MAPIIRSYKDLLVWQKSVDLAVDLYGVTRSFPASERYAMAGQIQRSGVSIPANIAEGHGKSGPGHYLSHLSHARGSLRELETLLVISNRIGYVGNELSRTIFARTDEIGRMLYGLSCSVQASRAPGVPRMRQ